MQILLISNKLNKQIKIKINDFEIINMTNVIKKTNDNNDSNDEMSIKFDIFETFENIFMFENKKFNIIKKIHD